MTDDEDDAETAAHLASLPADYDPLAYYEGVEPSLKEIFGTPVVGDNVTGDTLLQSAEKP